MRRRKMSDKNILVVDDEDSIRQMMCEIITRKFSNVSVESVSSGEEALEKIKSVSYDLIFLDIHLGDERINRLEVLKRIKEIRPEQKVYMITGYAVEEETKKILENNALGVLHKPFKINSLYEIIENYI